MCSGCSSLNSLVFIGFASCFCYRSRLGPGHLARFLPLTWVGNCFVDVYHPCIILSQLSSQKQSIKMSVDLIGSAFVSQSLNAFECIFAKASTLFEMNLCASASCCHNPSRLMPVAASKGRTHWRPPQQRLKSLSTRPD